MQSSSLQAVVCSCLHCDIVNEFANEQPASAHNIVRVCAICRLHFGVASDAAKVARNPARTAAGGIKHHGIRCEVGILAE